MKLKQNKHQGWLALIFFTVLSLPVFAQDVEEDLGDFSELKVFNGVEVEVIPAGQNRISITGHSKEDVKYELVGERLEIRLSLEHIWSEDNTLVRLYASGLETIDVNEGAIVELTEKLEGSSLTFRAQEAAAIYAPVSAKRVSAKAVTGGLVQLRGKTEDLQVELNTGGRYFGRDLQAEEAQATTGTGGHGEVYATDYLKATARLGGVIEVYGNPEELDRKTSLGGKVTEKNE